ncbi:MAG TPA: GGDEF domain-containing protein [Acidobacteriaceae bacterium]|nr:GGDEF domain-containing protein [Acidobacteriaceae bacterium]
MATLAAVAVCCVHAGVAGANTVRAASIGYLCFTLVMAGCAWAFQTRARLAQGALRIRWSLIAAAALAASAGYAPSFTQGILHVEPARLLQTACFNASEALYMMAAVLFFAGVARSIVLIDMLQALLFAVLRFCLAYSPASHDHFTIHHLIVGQFVALFLFLVALVACLGASSRAELAFLRTLSWFFGLRLISFFLSDQVSYSWLGYSNCSRWDVPGFALLAGFALYLLYTGRRTRSEATHTAPLPPPSVMVRSLMPSFLALVNLMLGLFLLQISATLAAVAISVSLVCYVVRTVLLQAQAMHDKALLQSRNEHLEGLAVRDPLTGIGNRRSLAGVYNRLQSLDGGKSLSLLLMDIDSFKQANDRHGHLHGDKVLIVLARKLESLAGAVGGSHCARLGGDEFALLLPGVTPQQASALAEKLRFLFSAQVCEVENGRVSLSVGIASLQAARDLPLETLVTCADEALYRAKRLGRNRVEVQPPGEPALAAITAGEESGASAASRTLELQHSAG